MPQLHEAGIWRIKDGAQIVDTFPVNIDTRESNLTPVGREMLGRIFPPENLHFLQSGEAQRLQVLGNRYGRELWREFLALALLLLLVELWISRAPQSAAPAVETA